MGIWVMDRLMIHLGGYDGRLPVLEVRVVRMTARDIIARDEFGNDYTIRRSSQKKPIWYTQRERERRMKRWGDVVGYPGSFVYRLGLHA